MHQIVFAISRHEDISSFNYHWTRISWSTSLPYCLFLTFAFHNLPIFILIAASLFTQTGGQGPASSINMYLLNIYQQRSCTNCAMHWCNSI